MAWVGIPVTTFRELVLKKLDDLMTDTIDDDVFEKFTDLRKSIVDDIETRAIILSRLMTLKMNETTPALVISYMLYGDVDQEQSIIDRNNVLHPGFVPGGIDVEVLSDVR